MPQTNAQMQDRTPTMHMRAASMRPGTWSEENGGSAEFVFATETPVREEVRIRELGGWVWVDQVLDIAGMTDAQIEAFRGASVLDSHMRYSIENIKGCVTDVRRETLPDIGVALVGRIQIDPTEEKVAAKVKNGSIRQVSVGFRFLDGATVQMREGDVPLMRQPFLPREVSLVAVGADPNAQVRSESENATSVVPAVRTITDTKGTTMNLDNIRAAAAALVAALGEPTQADPAANKDATDAAAQAEIEGGARSDKQAPVVVQAPVVAPAAGQRTADELTAIDGLRSVAKSYGREAEFETFVKSGETVAGLRSLAQKYVSTSPAEINGTSGGQRGAVEETLMSHDEAANYGARQADPMQAFAQAIASYIR